MSKRTVVFISSSAGDLTSYRNAAIQVCQQLAMPPLVMERFPHEQRTNPVFCRARVFEADLYLGLFAYRYGWQPPDFAGKSISELECEWACEKGIPLLVYLVDEAWRWPPHLVDLGDEGQKMQAFKTRLRREHPVRVFRGVKRFRFDLLAALNEFAARTGSD